MKKLSYKTVMKDIEENRNHSWIAEIMERHSNELDREILEYFGNNITYRQFYSESKKIAKPLKKDGIKKGEEFIALTDRIPEYVYLLGAASIIGAKCVIPSEKFDKKYLKEIIIKSKAKVIFVQDNKIAYIKDLLDEAKKNGCKIVTFSHKRSLKNDSYNCILEKYYNIHNDDTTCYTDLDKYIQEGADYDGDLFEIVRLSDPFTTTYSSGTTKKGYPKGIDHSHRHYITMGRYHDPEVSGLPSLKNYTTYSNIPAYSNSYLLSALSDNLILGGKVILDPIDNPKYFLIGSKIHKANIGIATTTTWLICALAYYNNEYSFEYLKEMLFPFFGGEPLSAGEEKFVNKFFKEAKFGVNITHTPISLAMASTAGADCEHGSVLIKIFRGLYNKSPYRIGRKDPVGMKPYDFVDFRVLRPDGTYCLPLEHGRIVANSPCNMIGYSHDPEATEEFYIQDAYGNTFGDMKVYGYYDEKRNISMKGRYNTDNSIPCYRIADEILKDTKKIMSCEVVKIKIDGKMAYVAHIYPQHGTSFNKEKVLEGALQRCIKVFGEGIQDILYFRIRSYSEWYPISSSIKRDIIELQNEGIEKAEKIIIKEKNNSKKLKRKR